MTNLKSLMKRRGKQVLDMRAMKNLKGGTGTGTDTNGGGGIPPQPDPEG